MLHLSLSPGRTPNPFSAGDSDGLHLLKADGGANRTPQHVMPDEPEMLSNRHGGPPRQLPGMALTLIEDAIVANVCAKH